MSSNTLLLGQSCALSGPAGEVGRNLRTGLLTSFEKINESGGLRGKYIELVSLDDRYEPELAISNTRRLIGYEDIFCLIGEVGTPTSKAVLPIAEQEEVPFIAPFTGADILRTPFKKQVFNLRASYAQEIERLVEYITEALDLHRVACLYQNDAFGQNGLSCLKQALAKRGMQLAASGHYERNTVAVKGALLAIRSSRPEAVVLVGAYRPCAAFISLAKAHGLEAAAFCTISFVGAESLQKVLGKKGEGCIISQVVPCPWSSAVPLVQEYRKAMRRFQPGKDFGFVSLEGFLAGRFFIRAMNAVQGPLSRKAFIRTVEDTGRFDLSGLTLRFGPGDHQGLDRVYLSVIRDGEVRPLRIKEDSPAGP